MRRKTTRNKGGDGARIRAHTGRTGWGCDVKIDRNGLRFRQFDRACSRAPGRIGHVVSIQSRRLFVEEFAVAEPPKGRVQTTV